MPAWRRGDEVIRCRGIAIDYSHHHHSVFNWNGPHSTGSGQVMVENHYDIENRYADKDGGMLDDLLKELAGKGRKEVEVDGSHFAGDHITLRHLLDWALFVDKEWREIDWPFVTDWLRRLGLPLQAPPPQSQYVETQSGRHRSIYSKDGEIGLESCGEAGSWVRVYGVSPFQSFLKKGENNIMNAIFLKENRYFCRRGIINW